MSKIESPSQTPFPRTPEDPRMSAQRLIKSMDERTVGVLLKLLGTAEVDETSSPTQLPTQKPGGLPPMIRAYDHYARTLGIPRETWKNAVLEPAFKQNASNPEALYRLIGQALADGFIEESLPPAQQLVKLDPSSLRSASLLGFVLLQLKRFNESLEVLQIATEEFGEDGYVLMRLARAYAGVGNTTKSEEILWRALMLDPNHEDALDWYVAIEAQREGKSGQLNAYRRIASLPDSWLAQLWLAGTALEEQDLDGATSAYKEVLQRFPSNPVDILMRISSDLAKRGELRLMIELLEPRFDAAKHGLLLGSNLIAAHIELKDTPAARHILEILYALQRPDWREHLAYWKKRIDEADYGPMKPPKPLGFELLRLGNPIWAYENSDFEALLPPKVPEACRIALVCGSGSFGTAPTETLGRLTRFIPMFIAEELQLRTEAQSIFILPWFASGGFVLSELPWQREQMKLEELNASFVLMMHVEARCEPWKLQFSLMAAADGLVLDTWEQPVEVGNPAPAALAGLRRVMQTLCLLNREGVSEDLAAPEGVQLNTYLEAIEQALAVSTANMISADNTPQSERFILNNLLQLAVDAPHSVRTRCLLVNTLYREAKRRPEIVAEYWERLQQLQDRHPLQAAPAWVAVAMTVESLGNKLKLLS